MSKETALQHYLRMKDIRANTPAILQDGVWFRQLGPNRFMLEEDFRAVYHIPENPYGAKCNPDGTKILKS